MKSLCFYDWFNVLLHEMLASLLGAKDVAKRTCYTLNAVIFCKPIMITQLGRSQRSLFILHVSLMSPVWDIR